jgi:hypothetical protein
MLEQNWSSYDIREKILIFTKKGNRLDVIDKRELFLIFALKRKIKLMSFLVNSEIYNMEFKDDNFIDVIENSAYDMGVILYREYFLKLTDPDKVVRII